MPVNYCKNDFFHLFLFFTHIAKNRNQNQLTDNAILLYQSKEPVVGEILSQNKEIHQQAISLSVTPEELLCKFNLSCKRIKQVKYF